MIDLTVTVVKGVYILNKLQLRKLELLGLKWLNLIALWDNCHH